MRASTLCLIFAALIALAIAQTSSFTADFELKRPNSNGAIVTGTLTYDRPGWRFRHDFLARSYAEIFKFQAAFGTGKDRCADVDQWMYQIGSFCDAGCRSARVDYPFPVYVKDTNVYQAATNGTTIVVGGQNCTHFKRRSSSKSNVTDIWFSETGVPCRALWADGAEYTFSNFAAANLVNTTIFEEPITCVCGDMIDIVILIDRSASIDESEYNDARRFAREFSRKFTLSPAQTHVAIAQFDTQTELVMDLYEGTSKANLDAAINAMSCACDDTLPYIAQSLPESVRNNRPVCCARRSSLSAALNSASVYLTNNGRPSARKAVLVISDGHHNTKADGTPCMNYNSCDKDLSSAITNITTAHKGLEIFGIGCGRIDYFRLSLLVDGKYEKLTNTSDYYNERNFYLTGAVGCQNPVYYCNPLECDGLCECTVCRAPDTCAESEDYCMVNTLNVAARTCEAVPRQCNSGSDLCNPAYCNTTLQACVTRPIECPPALNLCYENYCVPDLGICQSRRRAGPGGPADPCNGVHACTTSADCADNDACTDEVCVLDGSLYVCKYPVKNCNDNNICTKDTCDPAIGCLNQPVSLDFCNDGVDCTEDACLNNQCVHTKRSCNDGLDCTTDFCDDSIGGTGQCVYEPILCPVSNDNCTLNYCMAGGCDARSMCPEELQAAPLAPGFIALIVLASAVGIAGLGGSGYVIWKIKAAPKAHRGGKVDDFACE